MNQSDCDGLNLGQSGWEKPGRVRRAPTSTTQATNLARSGQASVTSKFNAGTNKNNKTQGMMNHKLEQSVEAGDTATKTLGKRFGQALIQARTAKKMNQKQLAQACNEKQTVVQQYEQGKAVPNPGVINKFERILGCKLPRK